MRSLTTGAVCIAFESTVRRYAYPWYTSVRALLDDSAYAPWFVDFKSEGPWHSPKCDSYGTPPKCSNHFHMQEQTPGFPHGDGDCAAPGCDCGKAPCGFYLWNHSSTAVVHNQTFQQWFINDYMLNKVGQSPLVSGFFWDDFWPAPGGRFPDSVGTVPDDTGLAQNLAGWGQITDSCKDPHPSLWSTIAYRGLITTPFGLSIDSPATNAPRPRQHGRAPRPHTGGRQVCVAASLDRWRRDFGWRHLPARHCRAAGVRSSAPQHVQRDRAAADPRNDVRARGRGEGPLQLDCAEARLGQLFAHSRPIRVYGNPCDNPMFDLFVSL